MEACKNWMNKIPVLYLTFDDIDGNDFFSAFSMFQDLFLDLFQSYSYLLEDEWQCKDNYVSIQS